MAHQPPVEPITELVEALRANDTSRVREILGDRPELGSRLDDALPGLPFGATALLAAVHHGNREMVELLLEAGADIDQKSHWWAGGFGVLDHDGELISFLIERGAAVDAYAAARHGLLEKLREIVRANPQAVHSRGGDGQTPLHVAATIEVAAFLLDHGADIDARDVDHESTPAQYMIRDRQSVARHLIARGCATDILMAAALGDLALVLRHLDADPDCIRMSVAERWFPKRDPRSGGSIYIWTLGHHKTAHSVAREFGHAEVERELFERSPADMRLALAAERGDDEVLRALLQGCPGLEKALSEADQRKLAYAAQNNDVGAVRRMLGAGWPVAVRGQHGGTPLHWAAWNGNAEMVREVLRHDPPLELRDQDYGATALGWAVHASVHACCTNADYAETVEALLAAGAAAPALTDDLEASDAVRAVFRRHGDKR